VCARTLFYFKTNRNAPRYKLITIDITESAEANWKDVLSHQEAVLNDVVCVGKGKYFVTCYMMHARETLDLYSVEGNKVQEIPLPDVGSVGSLAGRRDDMEFFYSFMGFVHAGVKLRFDLETMVSTKLREDVVVDHNSDDFETKQVFYQSKDGTKIPMFLVGRKGQVHTGDTCTLLYGYGGFSIPITPSFSPFRTVFIKHFNGLLAVANIRGGGEYGEEWHEAGIKFNKQNGFDDFQAAAEYLITEKYTNPAKIAINGGSNGGFLVAACCNQRPDLFACGIPQVGVMDMLRFHKFTIGYAWCADYGNADNSEAEFKNLHKLSPVPPTLQRARTALYRHLPPARLASSRRHDLCRRIKNLV
jgi:prolyl oligopeptidase